jgi:ring-1,2-phenylacetyl-CoA epoxidase subunit PaaC
MGFDTAYEAITEEVDDRRWAYGTGFTDPLAEVDTTLPAGVAGADLAEYCVLLGDDALVMSHRLQQWLTRAPELEEETALANIGLDLLGQAQLLLARAGIADGSGRSEDAFAFLRDAPQFRNTQFVEAPSADFAELVMRLLVFSTVRLAILDRLRTSVDPVLAALASKGVNEVSYHRDYAAGWVIRLGDGTPVSHDRVRRALDSVAPGVAELLRTTPLERRLAQDGVAVDPADVRAEIEDVLTTVLARATLPPLIVGVHSPAGGREGAHTAHLDDVLGELQSLAREHEGATW